MDSEQYLKEAYERFLNQVTEINRICRKLKITPKSIPSLEEVVVNWDNKIHNQTN